MKIVACQVAIYPLNTLGTDAIVAEMLKQMDWEGLEVQIGPMSTFLRGEEKAIWRKLQELYTLAANNHFVLNLTLSNYCGECQDAHHCR